MSRHTKIVATLGPASTSTEVLERLLRAGVDVVRLNFSHGTSGDHLERAASVREIARRLGRTVGILGDLQGPKIRVGRFESGKVLLVAGENFILDAKCAMGNRERAGLDYMDLPKDVRCGDILLLDDGRLKLEVTGVRGPEIHTRVLIGGELSNNKGINRQGGGLSAPALTAKDMEDIKTAAQSGVDFVAVSFPKSSADMYMNNKLREPGGITLDGVSIDLSKITAPAYFVSAIEDHIAPWKATYSGPQLFGGKSRFVLSGSGHIAGMINPPAANKYGYWTNEQLPAKPDEWLSGARQFEGSWWNDWLEWLKPNLGAQVAARVPGKGKLKVIEAAPGSYAKMRAEG